MDAAIFRAALRSIHVLLMNAPPKINRCVQGVPFPPRFPRFPRVSRQFEIAIDKC